MEYLFVVWKQADASLPTAIYSELDGRRMEVRKVEVFGNGEYGFASKTQERAPTRLGIEPVPSLSEILSRGEFQPRVGTAAEFEAVWNKARAAR